MNLFVTAIGTDSGKTLSAAILCEALQADYWKPVQAGLPRDSDTVRNLITNSHTVIHPETYVLKTPASPHAAARLDGVAIALDQLKPPRTDRNLIIEGAGGCLVPLNDKEFVIDLIRSLGTPVVLVSNLYLGSINHSLLTIEALNNRAIPITGIIFNGEANPESQRIILRRANAPQLLHIEKEKTVDRATVARYAHQLKSNWNERTFGN